MGKWADKFYICVHLQNVGFMLFHGIDDNLWSSIERYLSPQKSYTGRPLSDLRKLMYGILYVIPTGST
ncbi:MAG: hypothetical protein EHM20_15730 [Alphaproteobacteria bacterium]|nr:MAG: hypothetical protein EHM20_15730 [Alphaproteobacteria bacterium]